MAGQDGGDLKAKLKADFPALTADADFLAAKVYSTCSQGVRFRLERSKGVIKVRVLLISKKCGLIRPEFLFSEIKLAGAKECVVINNATKKPFLTIKQNDKTLQWEVLNNEAGNGLIGSIKVAQSGDIRSLGFSQNGAQTSSLGMKCPVQKAGFCSSTKPASLLNIAINATLKGITLEENPNGEACQNDLEVNAYYQVAPEQQEFITLISLLTVMARELQ